MSINELMLQAVIRNKLYARTSCSFNNRLPPTIQSLMSWPMFAIRYTPGLLLISMRMATFLVSSFLHEFEHFTRLSILLPMHQIYSEISYLNDVLGSEGDTSNFRTSAIMVLLRTIGYCMIVIRSSLLSRNEAMQTCHDCVHTDRTSRVMSLSFSSVVCAPAANRSVDEFGGCFAYLKRCVSCSCSVVGISQAQSKTNALRVSTPVEGLQSDSGNFKRPATPLTLRGLTWDGLFHRFLLVTIWLINLSLCLLFDILTGNRFCHEKINITVDPVQSVRVHNSVHLERFDISECHTRDQSTSMSDVGGDDTTCCSIAIDHNESPTEVVIVGSNS